MVTKTKTMTPDAEQEERQKQEAIAARWLKRVEKEIKAHKPWRDQAKLADEAYRKLGSVTSDAAPGTDSSPVMSGQNLFPIWWSTVQITQAAIFANAPKPDVRRRYADKSAAANDSGDNIARAIERALSFTIDTTAFLSNGSMVVNDFLVGACGQARVELVTETKIAPVIDPTTQQAIMGEDGRPFTQKIIVKQEARMRHWHWSKFGWEPSKDWESCDWIRFQHDMTEDEIEDQFGIEIEGAGARGPEGGGNLLTAGRKSYAETIAVQEIWDKKKKQRLWVCEQHPVPLDVEDDPLQLAGFYPCPEPIFTNASTLELIPETDYSKVVAMCEYINRLTARIDAITKQIKDVGFYDAQLGELAQLSTAKDGDRIPIKNLMERLDKASKADFDQVVAVQDNSTKIQVVRELMEQRSASKNDLFETLGISDIIRGATVASETAEAQKIKSQWGNVRIGPKIHSVANFFRDIFRLMAEIIAEHFEPEQIGRMTDMTLTPEEVQTLKQDMSRSYAIDVESDSTVATDDEQQKQQRIEAIKGLTDFLQVLVPMQQQNMIPADMTKEMLLFVTSSFKNGAQLSDVLNAMPDNMAQLQQSTQGMQEAQQQLAQCQEQLAEAQKQLQAVDQAKMQASQADAQAKVTDAEARRLDAQKNVLEAQTKFLQEQKSVPLTAADTEKKRAETEKVRAETRAIEIGVGGEESAIAAHEDVQSNTQMAANALAVVAQQLAEILPAIQQASVVERAKPRRIAVVRGPDGKIAGAEEVE